MCGGLGMTAARARRVRGRRRVPRHEAALVEHAVADPPPRHPVLVREAPVDRGRRLGVEAPAEVVPDAEAAPRSEPVAEGVEEHRAGRLVAAAATEQPAGERVDRVHVVARERAVRAVGGPVVGVPARDVAVDVAEQLAPLGALPAEQLRLAREEPLVWRLASKRWPESATPKGSRPGTSSAASAVALRASADEEVAVLDRDPAGAPCHVRAGLPGDVRHVPAVAHDPHAGARHALDADRALAAGAERLGLEVLDDVAAPDRAAERSERVVEPRLVVRLGRRRHVPVLTRGDDVPREAGVVPGQGGRRDGEHGDRGRDDHAHDYPIHGPQATPLRCETWIRSRSRSATTGPTRSPGRSA